MARPGSRVHVGPTNEGLAFQEEFVTRDAELALVECIQSLQVHEMWCQPFFRFGLVPLRARCSVSAAAASKSHDG